MTLPRHVVQQFHDHLNAGRTDDVLALLTEDVAIGGPRGDARGKRVVHDWIARARITMEPRRWIVQDDHVIVEQQATWQSDDGLSTQPVATLFTFTGDLISGIFRYRDQAEALASLNVDANEHEDGKAQPGG